MKNGTIQDLAGNQHITPEGPITWVTNSVTDALELNGKTNALPISEDMNFPGLPKKSMTASAWVMYTVPKSDGGIVGALQDSGSIENGWMLGYSGENFYFGLASKGGNYDGDGDITYLRYKTQIELGRWYHVAATYDGSIMTLYINGVAESTSKTQTGPILYSEPGFYQIGAYRDDNEYTRIAGQLKEVLVYDRALSAKEIKASFEPLKKLTTIPSSIVVDPELIVGPYLQWATQSEISILWETSVPASTLLEYGLTAELGMSETLEGPRKMHEIRLDGLKTQTKYFYRILSVAEDGTEFGSEIYTFQTAVEDESAYAFLVLSDTQSNPPVWGEIAERGWNERPNFGILAGDIVGTGYNTNEWVDEFFAPGAPLMRRVPIFTSLGNHEQDAPQYYKYMANPAPEYWYTFDYGNAQFFMLDSNRDMRAGSEQYQWLEKELASSTATWKFAVHHHPQYSSDENDYGDTYKGSALEGDPKSRPLIPLYERYGMDVVFMGHIHDYERTWPIKEDKVDQEDGVIYLQTGGAGGGLENYAPTRSWFTAKVKRAHNYGIVAIHEGTFQFQAFDLEGRLFDHFEIRK